MGFWKVDVVIHFFDNTKDIKTSKKYINKNQRIISGCGHSYIRFQKSLSRSITDRGSVHLTKSYSLKMFYLLYDYQK